MSLPVPNKIGDEAYPGDDKKKFKIPHYLGNYAINRSNVKRILLDKKA